MKFSLGILGQTSVVRNVCIFRDNIELKECSLSTERLFRKRH